MLKRRISCLTLIIGLVACAVPSIVIAFVFGVPLVRDWEIQRSIVPIEGARYIVSDTRQYSGNYKQKNIFYWTSLSILRVEQFYESFILAPFSHVSSNNDQWLIAAWEGSDIIPNPIRSVAIHTDLCDYHIVFECMTIALFDANQSSLSNIVQSMYGNSGNEIQVLPNSGTVIVFSYNIPDSN